MSTIRVVNLDGAELSMCANGEIPEPQESGAWVVTDGKLRSTADGASTAGLQVATAHAALREFLLHHDYPCVGAKSAFHRGSYRFGLYDALGPTSVAGLARDLEAFIHSDGFVEDEFATFVACFQTPRDITEAHFDRLLWQQLQLLHQCDDEPWPERYSADPDDPHFAWSFHGEAFFVVGLSPLSSRLSRRFPYPTLVFNPHVQFERLRANGQWDRMKEVIRDRDQKLQGDINPTLQDFGEASEARQYSSCPHAADWIAPFTTDPDE